MSDYKLEIGRGPICPHCQLDTFDDWWHDPTTRYGVLPVSIEARLKCHGCGKFFKVTQYSDGEHHSVARSKRRAA